MPIRLINNQKLIIAGTTAIEINQPYIICDEPQVRLMNANLWKIRCMFPVYESVAKWRADRIKNNIKTELLYKVAILFDFDETSGDTMQVAIDIAMKAKLVTLGIPEANISYIPAHTVV